MYILFHSTVLFVFIDTRVKNFAFLPVAYVSGFERKGGAKSRKTIFLDGSNLIRQWWRVENVFIMFDDLMDFGVRWWKDSAKLVLELERSRYFA